MSIQYPDAPESRPVESHYDDEIDLRQYLDVLIKWWREIVLMTILAAVVAGGAVVGLRQLTAPTYEATASIVIARLITEVNLDERIRTLSEEFTQSGAGGSRRAALVELVYNGAIAQAVIDELGDLLTEEEREPADLLDMVQAETPTGSDNRTVSDLIQLMVTANDPEKAATIANTWAKYYTEQINSIYGQVPADVVESVQAELLSADTAYQTAQQEFEEFIAHSRIDALQRQVDEGIALRDNLQAGRMMILANLADKDREARITLFNSLISAEEDSAFQVLDEQIQDQLQHLTQLYSDRALAQRYLAQAQNLQTQIDDGGEAAAATNALALQLLKAQVFANLDGVSLPANLYLTTETNAEPDAAGQQKDIDALVSTLDKYIAQLDTQLEEASQLLLQGGDYAFLDQIGAQDLAISAPLTATVEGLAEADATTLTGAIYRQYANLFDVGGLIQLSQSDQPIVDEGTLTQSIDRLERNIQSLRAQLAAEESLQRQLVQQSDLAWSSYDTLNNKIAELNLERTASNSEVRLGSPAIPPTKSIPGQSLIMAVVVAGALGFFIAIFVAFFANYLGYEPFLSRSKPQTVPA